MMSLESNLDAEVGTLDSMLLLEPTGDTKEKEKLIVENTVCRSSRLFALTARTTTVGKIIAAIVSLALNEWNFCNS
jgi:hypothetical protein